MSNKTNIEEDIEIWKELIEQYKDYGFYGIIKPEKLKALENILADRERLEKENEESIPFRVLYDFLITSVDEKQKPIWTEEHINELVDNFIIKWKEKI